MLTADFILMSSVMDVTNPSSAFAISARLAQITISVLIVIAMSGLTTTNVMHSTNSKSPCVAINDSVSPLTHPCLTNPFRWRNCQMSTPGSIATVVMHRQSRALDSVAWNVMTSTFARTAMSRALLYML